MHREKGKIMVLESINIAEYLEVEILEEIFKMINAIS
jgi:hypothetical protein